MEKKGKYVGTRQAGRKPSRARAAADQVSGGAKRKFPWWLPAGVLGLLLAVVLVAGFALKGGDTIYPNVFIGDVSVGGMHRDEAVAAIRDVAAQTYETTPLKMQLQDRTVFFRPGETKITIDAEAAVAAALQYGRSGGPVSALLNRLRSGEEQRVDVSEALTCDRAFIRQTAGETAAAVAATAKEPEITYDGDAKTLTIVKGIDGRRLDADDFAEAVLAAYGRGEFDSAYDYEITPCQPVDLAALQEKYGTPMVDAEYKADTHELIREQNGFGFVVEEQQKALEMLPEGKTLTIELKELIPAVTLDTLTKTLFPDVLGEYHSNHTAIPARTHNLELACASIDGTVLNPGEVFSFNKIVGERTAAKGYQSAIVYLSGGKSEPELGGGVCQVASTIYMACLLADLEIVERTEHMFVVTYVPMGMDATVYWGSLDFKFKNTTKEPLILRTSVSGGKVHVVLQGTRVSDKTVKMTYDVLATIPGTTVEKVDETKEVGYKEVTGAIHTGYRVQTYKNYYDKDGNLLETVKCAYSAYSKQDEVIILGPEEAPAEGTDPNAPTTEPGETAAEPDTTAPEQPPVTEPVTEPPAEQPPIVDPNPEPVPEEAPAA